jgi:hypothetical protein
MKITLNSNNEIHRKIGLMYGINSSKHYDLFVVEKPIMGGVQYRTTYKQEITIDLDTAEPDLRLAIGESMEFENYDPIEKVWRIVTMSIYMLVEFQEMKSEFTNEVRLSREWLESQNVEVSE